MHISAVNSCCGANNKCSLPKFRGLIKDKTVAPIIKNMSENDRIELMKIEKRLSRTKFWDMKISRVGKTFEDLKFEFIDKKRRHGIITGGIYPYDKQDNTIRIYSIIYGQENISGNVIEVLRYKSSDRADKVYRRYMQNLEMVRLRRYDLSPIESIRSKEIELNMLEEASHFAEEGDKSHYVSAEAKTKHNVGNDLYKHLL